MVNTPLLPQTGIYWRYAVQAVTVTVTVAVTVAVTMAVTVAVTVTVAVAVTDIYKAGPVPCHFKEGPASGPAKLSISAVRCRHQL